MNQLFTAKDLKKLIIPLVIEQILAVSVGMADTMMISSAGEAAVSGVSLVDMINNLLINVFAALATGGAVVASQMLGKKQPEEACKSAKQLLLVALALSTVIMGLCVLGRDTIIHLAFGSISQDVFHSASVYFLISALSYPFLGVYNASGALFRSMNNSKVTMQTSIIMNIINVIFNTLFIFGLQMGVAGAALGSLIARVAACVILFVRLHKPGMEISLKKEIRWVPDFGIIRKILQIGIPSGIENSFFQLGRILVVSIIAGFGTVQIAANAIANNLDGMGCIPSQAMCLAMITVVGRCVGAGEEEQVILYTKKMMKITYLMAAVWNVLILLLLNPILSIYNVSGETRNLAMILILIHDGFAIFMWPSSFTLPNALRAANDVRYPLVVSVCSMIILRIGLSFLLGKQMQMGAIGVWIGMLADWLCRDICFISRFLSGKWKKTMFSI